MRIISEWVFYVGNCGKDRISTAKLLEAIADRGVIIGRTPDPKKENRDFVFGHW